MKTISELSYEVWYQYKKSAPRRLAAFHFRFEAEKYIEVFHPKDAQYYYIIDSITQERL